MTGVVVNKYIVDQLASYADVGGWDLAGVLTRGESDATSVVFIKRSDSLLRLRADMFAGIMTRLVVGDGEHFVDMKGSSHNQQDMLEYAEGFLS